WRGGWTGQRSLFEALVPCFLSIPPPDATTLRVARLFSAGARPPAEMVKLSPDEIDRLIGACTFHEPKAKQIHEIARWTMDEHGGELPCEADVLLTLTFLYRSGIMTDCRSREVRHERIHRVGRRLQLRSLLSP